MTITPAPFSPAAHLLDSHGIVTPGYGQGGKWVGDRVALDRHAPVAEIAKAVRADIKAAVAAGDLPGKAEGIAYGVRSSSFSGGQSLSISVKRAGMAADDYDVSWAMRPTDPSDRGYEYGVEYAPEAVYGELADALRAMANRYISSDVDSQVDYFNVSCYLHVMLGNSGRSL